MKQQTLSGKTALVTGSGRGIGRGIALALAAEGCDVAINYFRNRAPAEETAHAVNALGCRAEVFKANVGDEQQIEHLVQETADVFGGVDIFIGNAASGVIKPTSEIGTKEWDWTMNINARSILLGVNAAAAHMRANGWGRIVTISSIGGRRVMPNYGVVGVSKAAVETLTRYLAVELAPHGITVNCVSPGLVRTDALKFFPHQEGMLTEAETHTPAGRLATPEDVGHVVTWLCSPQAQMVVGQTIEVDGGHSLLGRS
ncbi:MAG: enoyl-[acyl-carrier-protein] reductase FabL [Chloroflexota bacterium]